MTASIDPAYGKRKFNKNFEKHLKNVLPENDHKKPNDFLIVRTCSQAINFLVLENPQKMEHFIFVDLLANLGPISTTAILLKVILFCRKVMPYLEKRLSLLFNNYEDSTRDTVAWLINAFENINVALATNFGSVKLLLPS